MPGSSRRFRAFSPGRRPGPVVSGRFPGADAGLPDIDLYDPAVDTAHISMV